MNDDDRKNGQRKYFDELCNVARQQEANKNKKTVGIDKITGK